MTLGLPGFGDRTYFTVWEVTSQKAVNILTLVYNTDQDTNTNCTVYVNTDTDSDSLCLHTRYTLDSPFQQFHWNDAF